jgi:hypothetical protein
MNKSTEDGVENERRRHKYDDVYQITPARRPATAFRGLNLVFRHSQEIMVSAQNRKPRGY